LKSGARLESGLVQQMERQQRRLRRIRRAHAERLAAQVLHGLRVRVARHDDARHAIAVGIAHRHGAALAVGAPLRVEPGERRVPRDVDVPGEQRVHLQLVVGVEHAIDRAAVLGEELLDRLPDGRDLGVVDHRADEQRSHECFLRSVERREDPCARPRSATAS
jgi:hypothetical protein